MGHNSEGISIAIIGATGAVGRDLLEVIGQTSLPIAALRLFASMGSIGETIEVDGRSHRVWGLAGVETVHEVFEGIELVFLAAPPDVSQEYGPALADMDIPVIDIGAALAHRGVLSVPSVSIGSLADFPDSRIACSPSGPAGLISSVLAPLAAKGANACPGTATMSAGLAGKAGIRELSEQVIALFNQKDPPREVFPTGLAFDVHAQIGEDDNGWTGVERRLALEIASVIGWTPDRLGLTAVLMPVFTGIAVSLVVEFDHHPNLEGVRETLEQQPLIRMADALPGPRRVAGESPIFVGRLRADAVGEAVHLWAVCDNLRCAASGNALAIAHALWSDGHL